jgi:ribosomal protein S18 acetylase RimI-like enzyme
VPRFTARKGQFRITTDPRRMDVGAVHAALSRTPLSWARGIPRRVVAKSIRNSLCFGVFDGSEQIGFARVVTDSSTYAYLCDVYILESHQGRGLGKWLISVVMKHPSLQGLRRFQLVTRNAHGLYTRFGFTPVEGSKYHMEIFRPGLYVKPDKRR